MKHRRPTRFRASLLAILALGAGDALGRDTAGPEAPRPPPTTATPTTAPTTATASPAIRSPATPAAATPSSATATAEPPSSADAERAKELYAAGAEAFAAQRNADAIRYFRRAAELVPSAKLTYNIGLAYEEMGDAGRALAEYRSYLTQEREADAARLDDVRTRITNLERRLAETGVQQLLVTSAPSGATVRIGGRALGVTPWAGELPPGRHHVVLELPGHEPRQAEVTLAADRSTELTLALAPRERDADRAEHSAGISPLAWTFLGVGTAGLAGGLVFELARSSSSHDADRASDPLEAAEARGSADAQQTASVLLFGFGAGFTIGGAVLLALDLSRPRPSRAESAWVLPCSPSFCGALTRGHF